LKSLLAKILSPFPDPAIAIESAEFSRCVDLARWHGLEALFYSRLKKNYAGLNACIDDYIRHNENIYLQNIAVSMQQEAVEKEVVATLGKQGIPACIIKGNEIARSLYGDPNCRSSADIDVLVKKADVIKSDKILRAAHYTADEISLNYFLLHQQHAKYCDPVFKTLIELHWRFGIPYFFNLSSEQIWKEVFIGEGGYAKLSREMLIILLLIHHHNHSFSELKILVDILWAFQKYEKDINWPEFSQKLKNIGLTKVAILSISQIESLWPDDIYRILSLQSLKQLLAAMGCRVSKHLVSYFRMNLNRVSALTIKDKIVGRFALDGLGNMFISYIKTILPPPVVIRELYHATGALMLPVSYLRFIGWRVKVWRSYNKQ